MTEHVERESECPARAETNQTAQPCEKVAKRRSFADANGTH